MTKALNYQKWVTNSLFGRLFFILIPFCVVGYFSFLTRHYQIDDALIYLRYVKNFHNGFGLVYNPGERFNGLTSPVFTYFSIASSFVFRNLQTAMIVMSAVYFACASILGGKLLSNGKWEALFTTVVVGSFGYFYSTFGMETPLFLVLIALSLYLYKLDSEYFVIALALLINTRYEGVFLALPLAADFLIKNRKLPDAKLLTISLAIVLIPFVFNYLYYGDILPATANAKLGQGKSGFWEGHLSFLNMNHLIKNYFSNSDVSAYFFLLSSAYGLYVSLKERIAVVIVIFLVLLACFYVGLNLPNYPWYYGPFFYQLLIFSCRGVWKLFANLFPRRAFDYRVLAFFVLCVLTGYMFKNVVSFKEKGRIEEYARIGGWLKMNTPSNASVAMVEIGTVGYYSDRFIVDVLGLVNKYNADYIAKSDVYGWLSHYQPDYILRHEPIWRWEVSTITLEKSGAYIPVDGFNYPKFVLLKKTDKYSNTEIANYFRNVSEQVAATKELKQ